MLSFCLLRRAMLHVNLFFNFSMGLNSLIALHANK